MLKSDPSRDAMSEPSVQIDDVLIVARLKQRDRSAWEELLRVRGAKLYGVALRFMCDEHDAEDVMQDALVAVWNKIGSLEGRVGVRLLAVSGLTDGAASQPSGAAINRPPEPQTKRRIKP